MVSRGFLLVIIGLVLGSCESPSSSAVEEQQKQTIKTFRDCPDCPLMALLPPGKFSFGAKDSDKEAFPHERPSVEIEIPKSFAVSVYEVTNDDFKKCLEANVCTKSKTMKSWMYRSSPKMPVTAVSWAQARVYAQWISEKAGAAYRLPTEIEWEYAARGGTDTLYWWGDEMVMDLEACAICQKNGRTKGLGTNGGNVAVGSYQANPFGLFDMFGNVSEWTLSCLEDRLMGAADGVYDSEKIEINECEGRIVRGFSTNMGIKSSGITYRRRFDAMAGGFNAVGFRLVRDHS